MAHSEEVTRALDARAQRKAEAHHTYAMGLGGAWSFLLKDGRVVTIEMTRLGVIEHSTSIGMVFRQRKDGANPVWFRVRVDGELWGDDGWLGFHNPPTIVGNETEEDVGRALHTIIADALGGELCS